MIPLDNAVVARLESFGEKFEILVDPHQAALVRQGQKVDIEDVVAALNVFSNSSKATRASDESLIKVFKTTDFDTIARRIIEKGEIHLTSEQRKEMIEGKRRQIVAFIARNAVNPQTGHPHPPHRIEMAMEEARVNIDPFKHLDEQVKEVVKALRPILPIRFEELRLAIKIPPDFAAKSYGDIAAGSVMEKDEWLKDGSWVCVVRIPAGIQEIGRAHV
jgi:ribosome maturation protein SDO1